MNKTHLQNKFFAGEFCFKGKSDAGNTDENKIGVSCIQNKNWG